MGDRVQRCLRSEANKIGSRAQSRLGEERRENRKGKVGAGFRGSAFGAQNDRSWERKGREQRKKAGDWVQGDSRSGTQKKQAGKGRGKKER